MCPCMFGFQAIGIAAGSCASCFQSCCYGAVTAGGGLFAHCTSAGMTGLGWCCCGSPILTVIWAVITVLGIIIAALYFTGTFTMIKLGVLKLWCQFENFFYSKPLNCSATQNSTVSPENFTLSSSTNSTQMKISHVKDEMEFLPGPQALDHGYSDTTWEPSMVVILGMCVVAVLLLMFIVRVTKKTVRRQYVIV
eukprot:TRINITY_DN60542_c0_g1_i1.p1 TRINITY_DN60542_c0_g1~~TRINITY_DN60542_c0_g1_i1.p1  ORF type:complete len:194 (-),score=35.28 TRINITY_DN60542_c0_g1_i1:25-606(-)